MIRVVRLPPGFLCHEHPVDLRLVVHVLRKRNGTRPRSRRPIGFRGINKVAAILRDAS